MVTRLKYSKAPQDVEEALERILSGDVPEVSLEELLETSGILARREKITISLDSKSVQAYRDYAAARGLKYQTIINEVVKKYAPVDR